MCGEIRYLFCSMDDDTKIWITQELTVSKYQHNANNLLHQTLEQTGKKLRNFITDRLPAYAKSGKRVFGKIQDTSNIFTYLVRDPKITTTRWKRLNGEIRDREKVMRGLKKDDTALIYQA